MQTPDGRFHRPKWLDEHEDPEGELVKMAAQLEQVTGKPHPVFSKGDKLEIRGGQFMVLQILPDRLILKPVKY